VTKGATSTRVVRANDTTTRTPTTQSDNLGGVDPPRTSGDSNAERRTWQEYQSTPRSGMALPTWRFKGIGAHREQCPIGHSPHIDQGVTSRNRPPILHLWRIRHRRVGTPTCDRFPGTPSWVGTKRCPARLLPSRAVVHSRDVEGTDLAVSLRNSSSPVHGVGTHGGSPRDTGRSGGHDCGRRCRRALRSARDRGREQQREASERADGQALKGPLRPLRKPVGLLDLDVHGGNVQATGRQPATQGDEVRPRPRGQTTPITSEAANFGYSSHFFSP